ncbi:tryptophan-rich sensory protein [Candidatus Pacearchaeota archaeon]|nr:tryptophan-rich sensory protein [Candidatus Pacearchaeota archaeon]
MKIVLIGFAIWEFIVNPFNLSEAKLFFNAMWSYLFFSLQNPTLAFIDLSLIWITIILLKG